MLDDKQKYLSMRYKKATASKSSMPSLKDFEDWCSERNITGFTPRDLQNVYEDVCEHRRNKTGGATSKPTHKEEVAPSRAPEPMKTTRTFGR